MSDVEIEVRVAPEEQQFATRYAGQIITDEDEVKAVVDYLMSQYEAEQGVREPKKSRWEKWRRQLDADPEDKPAQTRLENPSRVRPPLAQINGQTMFAKLDAHFALRDPFWTAKAVQETSEAHDDAEFLTKYLDILARSPTDLDLARVKSEIHLDAAVMPVAFAKVTWTTERRYYKKVSGTTGGGEDVTVTVHDGPEISMWPIEQTVWPSAWNDVNKMPWIAFEFELPPHEVRAKGARGEWILANEVTAVADPANPEPIKFVEFHFFWDIAKNNIAIDMIWTIHPETRVVVSQTYNELGARSMEPFRYIRKTKSVEGRGTGQLCESAQDEVEGIHNVRNDNMKIANMRMFAMKRSVLTNNRSSIYAGKLWLADNPREDIVPLQLGEVYPSSYQTEGGSWSQAAQATGLSESERGFADSTLGSRDTWRGAQARLGQSGGIFTSTAEGMKQSWSRVGMLLMLMLILNRELVVANERRLQRLSEDKLKQLDRILNIEAQEVPRRFSFEVATTEMDLTYAAMQQSTLALTQIYTVFAKETIPLALQLFGPQGLQMRKAAPDAWQYMLSILVGSNNLMEATAKFFNYEETERYIPDLKKWEFFLNTVREIQRQQVEAAGGLTGVNKDGQRNVGGGAGQPAGGEVGGGIQAPGFGTGGASGPGGAASVASQSEGASGL